MCNDQLYAWTYQRLVTFLSQKVFTALTVCTSGMGDNGEEEEEEEAEEWDEMETSSRPG